MGPSQNHMMLDTISKVLTSLARLLEYSYLPESADQVRILRELVLYKIVAENKSLQRNVALQLSSFPTAIHRNTS